MQLRRTSGILIPRKYENEDFYVKIKEELLRYAKDYGTSVLRPIRFFEETERNLVVPRYFPVHKYIPEHVKIVNDIKPSEKINIKHNISPRNEVQERAIKYMMTHDRGIIQLQPGTGKTVISIYMICEKNKKTFILVHRDPDLDPAKRDVVD